MSIPVLELESSSLLEKYRADRPVFHGRVSRIFRCEDDFQVFACRTGFLFLELTRTSSRRDDFAFLRWISAIYFGLFAVIGYAIIRSMQKKKESKLDLSNSTLSDDELVELARTRRRSFLARYDDIKWARVEPPDWLERLTSHKDFQGTITLREAVVGRVKIGIVDKTCMDTAIDAFSRRLGDRVRISAALDHSRSNLKRKY